LRDESSLRKTTNLELIYRQADITSILDVYETKLCFIHFSVDTETICNPDMLQTRQNELTDRNNFPFSRSFTPCAQKCDSIPDRNNRFFSLQNDQTGSETHPASSSRSTKSVLFPGAKRRCVQFSTNLHLVPRQVPIGTVYLHSPHMPS